MTLSHTSDSTASSLIVRVKAKDEEAWTRLSTLYGPVVYTWARRAGLGEADAADVVQEVFQSLSVAIAAFEHGRPGQTFRGWLRTIARNKVRDFFRASARRPAASGGANAQLALLDVTDDAPDDVSSGDASSDFDEAEAARMVVHRAAQYVQAEFTSRTWQAFERTAIGGENPGDVAAELGISVGAVYIARCRVLRRLRDELDGLL